MRENAHDMLAEVRRLLVEQHLLDPDEELIPEMLEDVVHFAYFTGCISKRDVQRFLGLDERQVSEKIRAWKRWNEGNRSCQLRQNPFYEGWSLDSAISHKQK